MRSRDEGLSRLERAGRWAGRQLAYSHEVAKSLRHAREHGIRPIAALSFAREMAKLRLKLMDLALDDVDESEEKHDAKTDATGDG